MKEPTPMPYRLTHPDSDLEIERDKGDLPNYLAQGWQRVKPARPAPAPAPATPQAPRVTK